MKALILVLLLAVPAAAQETIEVRSLPDAVSWATAAINPSVAAFKAIRSNEPKCELSRLLVAEGLGNGSALLLKHFLMSPRPAAGLAPDGMPSGHSMNSMIGVDSTGWFLGGSFALGTGGLRVEAHRHTRWQVLAGLALGAGTEWASYRLVKCAA